MLLVLGVSCLVSSGCGSGAGSSSRTAPRPHGGFISQLSALCRQDRVATRAAAKTVAAQSAAQRRFIRKLRALTPTAPLEPILARYLSLLERELAAFERHDVAADRAARQELQPVVARLRRAGATSC